MDDLEGTPVDLAAYLTDLPLQAIKPRLPDPVRYRAEQLADVLRLRARALGSKGRDELLAALIHNAPEDPAKLRRYIETYREAQVWQTVVGEARTTGSILIPPPGLGRPPRTAE